MEMLRKLRRGMDLSFHEADAVFDCMLDGAMEERLMEETLVLLAEKGETGEEIAAAACALRKRAIQVDGSGRLLDVVGTGGDGSGSFNISTAAAIVCSLFVPVAKHGNRAVSSRSGSADVLEELKVPIDLDKPGAEQYLREKNFVFLFAQKFHPAMKAAAPVRSRIGRRTIFNLLGPLCNPASPDCQLIGIFSPGIMATYMEAIERIGIPKVILVSSTDGLDEVSISAPTICLHKRGNSISRFRFDPKDFGIDTEPGAIKGYDPVGNARIMREAFKGKRPALANAIAVNAAFGLVAAEVECEIHAAFLAARESIENGRAYEKLMGLSS